MTRPGTQISVRENPPSRTAPTDTSVWFVAGFAEQGPVTPVLVTTIDEFVSTFGDRAAYSYLYDALDVFFREGGNRAYVCRVVGPSPVKAFLNLKNDSDADCLKVEAKYYGDYGNALKVQVVAGQAGGTFVLVISTGSTELERSGDLADQAAAIAWSSESEYVNVSALAGSGDPKVASATSLATGADDHANATDTQWDAALAKFSADLGPGQVSYPGRTTTAAHTALLTHAQSHNRVALLDAPDTATVGTLTAAADAQRPTTDHLERFGGLFAPWDVVPGLVPASTRTVPPCARVAGQMARLDSAGNSPNVPAAGVAAEALFALEPTQTYSDANRETLNDAGVNVSKIIYGGLRTYGYRTLAEADDDKNWLPLSNARLAMAIRAKADAVAENFVFAQIDGRKRKISQFNGELKGMLVPYFDAGSLYGERPEEAFAVDTGPSVNTEETLADGQLRAVILLRMSPFAELVSIELVKTATSEALA